jgi:hypothetical protein
MLKIIFITITLLHGLIHFMGFAKAFSYGNITQLTKEISKPMGFLWFITGFLFIICITMQVLKKDNWVYFGFVAVVLSQVLIFSNWHDARFGTVANVLILVFCIYGYFQIKFKNEYKNEVKIAMVDSQKMPHILTESELAPLPDLVRKYIRYTGCVGKATVNNFKIKFTGKIRDHAKPVWMELNTVQYNFIKTPTRLFYLDATMKGLPVAGFHCFKNGIAFMDIRLLSIFKVEYQSGAVMNVSETVTFFNDICCMAPGALVDERIKWLEVEGNKVKASFTNNGITISAWLYFNEKGELVNFVSEDRSPLGKNGESLNLKWSTPLRDYKEINGYKLASYAETIYSYPEGDFTYATFTLKDIGYNLTR